MKVKLYMSLDQLKKYRYGKSALASTNHLENSFEVYVDQYQISIQREDEEGNSIPADFYLIDPEL